MEKSISHLTTKDNLKLRTVIWKPAGEIKGALAIVHGHGEHAQRYDHVAEKFTEKGIAVMGMDHRGHGKSEGPRGHTPEYDHMLEDIGVLLEETSKAFGEVPTLLMGHSMGGNLVTNYMLRKKHSLRAVLISSPWYRLAIKPPAIMAFASKVLNVLWPSLALSSNLDANLISTIPAEVKRYQDDPLVHDLISSRLFNGMVDAGEWAIENADKVTLPIFIGHGDGDKICSHLASQEFFKKVKSDSKIEIFPGGFHELHNDKAAEKFISALVSFAERQIG